MQGAKQVDVSAWHSGLVCANYSAQKAQVGISDHQAAGSLHWPEQPCRNAGNSAFLSQTPRLVALPTDRSNDSKCATSLWGHSNRDHYSGAIVGPGSYEALHHHFLESKYPVVLHACCSNDLGLPRSLKASKKVSISQLVHRCSSCRHLHVSMAGACDEYLACDDRLQTSGDAVDAWALHLLQVHRGEHQVGDRPGETPATGTSGS